MSAYPAFRLNQRLLNKHAILIQGKIMSRYEQKINNKHFSIKLILILIVLMALAIFWYQRNHRNSGEVTKQIEIPIEKPSATIDKKGTFENNENSVFNSLKKQLGKPKDVQETEQKLPSLDHSDDSFKESVENVSPGLIPWFNIKDVIRKYIILINDLSQNQILFKHRNFLNIPQKIVVKKDRLGLYLAKESYNRFDHFANAISSIDANKGVRLYLTFRPLFKQIYNEFSYPPEYRLEDIFLKAAANVIHAPSIETRIALIKYPNRYKFADNNLELLNNVEKLMLRMGPKNTKKIQRKLRQLIEAFTKLDES